MSVVQKALNVMTKLYNKRVAIGLFIVIALITSYISTTDGGDFDAYLQAARQLYKGENIYAPPFVKGLQYYYSVFFALLLMPFGHSVFITEFIWLLLSYALLYRSAKLITTFFDLRLFSEKEKRIWAILSFLLALQFIMYNVSMIQVTFLLLWAGLETLQLLQHKKFLTAGILLAVMINMKLMLIIILPYLFYRGYFKTLSASIITFIVLLFLPALFIGQEYNNLLLHEWWNIINPTNNEHMFEAGIGTHSIVAWLPVYLTDTVGVMPYKRNFINLNTETVSLIINIVRIVFLGISIFFLQSMPFKKEQNRLKTFWEYSYFLVLIPLLLPHQQKYNFILAIPMIMYILYFFIATAGSEKTISCKIILALFILSMIIYSPIYGSDVIGNFLFKYTQHYRFLTFSTIFLIPVALYCNPKRLSEYLARTRQDSFL